MKKAAKRMLIGFLAAVLLLAAALPFAVPPLVERIVREKIDSFGLFSHVSSSLGWCWRNGPGLSGRVDVSFPGSPWRIRTTFGGSCCEWFARVEMDETAFDEHDPVLQALLRRYPVDAVSNLVFSGSVSLDARAERTFRKPVPVWSAKLPLKRISVEGFLGEKPFAVRALSLTPGVSGLADHFDIAPIFFRAEALTAIGMDLSNVRATVRATERSLMVNEATARFCGGEVALYSVFLNLESLNTGFTLFMDDIDAGEALGLLRGFRGEASGRLHGKLKLRLADGGRRIRLSDAYLYSAPGEVGKLKVQDAASAADYLAMAGLDEATRANVSKALSDIDYSVLRLDLRRGEGKSARLSVRLAGSATRGGVTVPVDLTLNFNGELEQILNTGLGLSARTKGKDK